MTGRISTRKGFTLEEFYKNEEKLKKVKDRLRVGSKNRPKMTDETKKKISDSNKNKPKLYLKDKTYEDIMGIDKAQELKKAKAHLLR